MNQIDFTDTDKMRQLFKQAVNKAVETHYQKGESIAVSDKNGKVQIVSAQEIPEFKKRLYRE